MTRVEIPEALAREVAEHPERFRPDMSAFDHVLGFFVGPEGSDPVRVVGELGRVLSSLRQPAQEYERLAFEDEYGGMRVVSAWLRVRSADQPSSPKVGERVLVLDSTDDSGQIVGIVETRIPPRGGPMDSVWTTCNGRRDGIVITPQRWAILPPEVKAEQDDDTADEPTLLDIADGVYPSGTCGWITDATSHRAGLAAVVDAVVKAYDANRPAWQDPAVILGVLRGVLKGQIRLADAERVEAAARGQHSITQYWLGVISLATRLTKWADDYRPGEMNPLPGYTESMRTAKVAAREAAAVPPTIPEHDGWDVRTMPIVAPSMESPVGVEYAYRGASGTITRSRNQAALMSREKLPDAPDGTVIVRRRVDVVRGPWEVVPEPVKVPAHKGAVIWCYLRGLEGIRLAECARNGGPWLTPGVVESFTTDQITEFVSEMKEVGASDA